MGQKERCYLNEKQVAEITGLSLSTLRNHRHQRKGIPYAKYGRAVRYDSDDVYGHMDSNKLW